MPSNKLTIVPVYLDPLPTENTATYSSQQTTGPSCVIKTAAAEISFFNGVDPHIIQTLIKELMSLHKESSFDNLVSRPNSGKTVSKRLDYFSYEELPNFDLRPQLPDVQTKAFIYGGIYDAQCPYEYAVEVANLLPNATLTTFKESNHFPFVEEELAFEQFVETITKDVSVKI